MPKTNPACKQLSDKNTEILRIDDPKAKHSYEVQVSRTDYAAVDADNRSKAARLVKARGFVVLSVNLVG